MSTNPHRRLTFAEAATLLGRPLREVARFARITPELPYIEDGERLVVQVLDVRITDGGFAVRYEHDGHVRDALLPCSPLPVGGDHVRSGRLCRLELVENGGRIIAVHDVVSR